MNILVVEDELIIQLDIKIELEDNGFVVFTADRGDDAIDIVENNDIDCVLMDINIKGNKNGIETANIIRDNYDIPIIFSTANNDLLNREEFPYVITKPFNINEIKNIIEEVKNL
ncbi:MAG: response regulator [Methanobrevibacter sp.]|uniref:response regulator n=1 Tax=Methanobrevibacter sp. TaxID=66852 RepID=UPI0026E09E79|nr:response regulator [Methanobrevibacter sp.]MDO5849405.1 response regulator [Methanobrevibacter sp.]